MTKQCWFWRHKWDWYVPRQRFCERCGLEQYFGMYGWTTEAIFVPHVGYVAKRRRVPEEK